MEALIEKRKKEDAGKKRAKMVFHVSAVCIQERGAPAKLAGAWTMQAGDEENYKVHICEPGAMHDFYKDIKPSTMVAKMSIIATLLTMLTRIVLVNDHIHPVEFHIILDNKNLYWLALCVTQVGRNSEDISPDRELALRLSVLSSQLGKLTHLEYHFMKESDLTIVARYNARKVCDPNSGFRNYNSETDTTIRLGEMLLDYRLERHIGGVFTPPPASESENEDENGEEEFYDPVEYEEPKRETYVEYLARKNYEEVMKYS